MAASFSGILVTVIVLGILIAIHEAGHFLAAKSLHIPVRQFAIGFGSRVVGFRWGETECRLNWIPLGGYCAFADDQEPEPVEGIAEEPPPPEALLRNRPIWQRTWVVSAGVIFNFVSAWLILFGSNLGLGIPTGHQVISVKAVTPNTPAAKAGLLPGDRFLTLGGKPVEQFEGFRAYLQTHKGKTIPVEVQRDGKAVLLSAVPDADGRLGFRPSLQGERRPAEGLGEVVRSATDQQIKFTVMLSQALWGLVSAPSEKMDQIGGPVAVVAMGDQVYQGDPWLLLEFAVILSIELAIFNLLPLPALDGGHLVLLAIEKVRRRPLPRAVEERILVAGFVLIMGLGMMLILKDIFSLPAMYGPAPTPGPSAPSSPPPVR
ncbi:MAG: RIP metalloprotease RseP [Candidatus Sericytochromatia bacterium]|nr:RIP metalloprotease RseP [Candidatus Sericytochromatia bacterium]